MKRKIIMFALLTLVCLAATGCQKDGTPQNEPQQSAPSESVQPDASGDQSQATTIFTSGTWMASNGESGQYYFFDADGISGRTASYENGIGVGFTYEQKNDEVVFRMGASDMSAPGKVVVTDSIHVTIEWEAQCTETLTFVSDLDSDHFHFYTDEELCALALADYEAKHGESETELSTAAADNGDGTATVQIYQLVGDHNSTAAWYSIDRCTGEGKDVNSGETIDLTNGSPDIDISSADSSSLPADYAECTIDNSDYQSTVLLTPEVPVTDFKVVALEYTDANSFSIKEVLLNVDLLTTEKPAVLFVELPEIIPNVGIMYKDRNGNTAQYTITMSGLTGAPLLIAGEFTN